MPQGKHALSLTIIAWRMLGNSLSGIKTPPPPHRCSKKGAIYPGNIPQESLLKGLFGRLPLLQMPDCFLFLTFIYG